MSKSVRPSVHVGDRVRFKTPLLRITSETLTVTALLPKASKNQFGRAYYYNYDVVAVDTRGKEYRRLMTDFNRVNDTASQAPSQKLVNSMFSQQSLRSFSPPPILKPGSFFIPASQAVKVEPSQLKPGSFFIPKRPQLSSQDVNIVLGGQLTTGSKVPRDIKPFNSSGFSGGRPFGSSGIKPFDITASKPFGSQVASSSQSSCNSFGIKPFGMSCGRPSQVSGNRPLQFSGNRPSRVSGNKASQVSGNKPPQVSGNKPSQVSGNKPPQASGNKPSQVNSNKLLQVSGYRPLVAGIPTVKPAPKISLPVTKSFFKLKDPEDKCEAIKFSSARMFERVKAIMPDMCSSWNSAQDLPEARTRSSKLVDLPSPKVLQQDSSPPISVDYAQASTSTSRDHPSTDNCVYLSSPVGKDCVDQPSISSKAMQCSADDDSADQPSISSKAMQSPKSIASSQECALFETPPEYHSQPSTSSQQTVSLPLRDEEVARTETTFALDALDRFDTLPHMGLQDRSHTVPRGDNIEESQNDSEQSRPNFSLKLPEVEPSIREQAVFNKNLYSSQNSPAEQVEEDRDSEQAELNNNVYSSQGSQVEYVDEDSETEYLPPVDLANPFGETLSIEDIAKRGRTKKTAKYDAELPKMYKWLAEYGPKDVTPADIQSGKAESAVVDYVLSEYLSKRYNLTVYKDSGIIIRLDPNTFGPLVSRLVSALESQTDYRPSCDPEFRLLRDVRKDYMEHAKQDGLGKLANQADPFSMAELNLMFQSDHLDVWHPWGLQTLLFFELTTYFNARVCEEIRNMTFGDFTEVMDPETGLLAYVMYIPRTTKKDKGERAPSAAASSNKRPIACRVGNGRNKYDFSYVLAHQRRQVMLLGLDTDIEDTTLFWECRNKTTKPGASFYGPRPMGLKSYNELVRNVVSKLGIDRSGKNTSNQSMRSTTFNAQDALGLTNEQKRLVSGHVSDKTADIYMRKLTAKMAKLGGLMAALVSGGEAEPVFPTFDKVMMLDGTTRTPDRVVPVHDMDGQVLFGSDLGLKVGQVEVDPEQLPVVQPPREIAINTPGFHHEGGRVTKQQYQLKRKKKTGLALKTGKRIKQQFAVDEQDSDEDDEDNEYVAKVGEIRSSDRAMRQNKKVRKTNELTLSQIDFDL